MKKKLTQREEFEIMKLVLDKFLWLGFAVMAVGLWRLFLLDLTGGFSLLAAGAIVLVIFLMLIVKEYEIIK